MLISFHHKKNKNVYFFIYWIWYYLLCGCKKIYTKIFSKKNQNIENAKTTKKEKLQKKISTVIFLNFSFCFLVVFTFLRFWPCWFVRDYLVSFWKSHGFFFYHQLLYIRFIFYVHLVILSDSFFSIDVLQENLRRSQSRFD